MSVARSELVSSVAERVVVLSPGRVRVAIDGRTGSGKTSFANELAAQIRKRGRPTLRATLDDFKKPWSHSIEHGYDRSSGEGYYRNPHDFESTRRLMLEPAGRLGSGVVVLCAFDPLTGVDHRSATVKAPDDAVLVVDGVFAFRPEYNDLWEYRIYLEVDSNVAVERGVTRDTPLEGRAEAVRLHRDRYTTSELIYESEVDPRRLADLVVDNTALEDPFIVTMT